MGHSPFLEEIIAYVRMEVNTVGKYSDVRSYMMPIEQQLAEIREMLEILLPQTCRYECIFDYAVNTLKNTEYENISTKEMHTDEQITTLVRAAKKQPVAAVWAAIIIGFANGAEWRKKRCSE